MKKLFNVVLIIGLLGASLNARSQNAASTRYSIAVFVPLYLDSAFDGSGEYTYGKNFPKFLNPGLEFYEGIQLAADSLNKTGAALDVRIYDTKARGSLTGILQKPELANVSLMIGYVSNPEIKILSDAARQKNIPFINVNIPNNAGVTNNPSLVILNSTLRTHIQGIYKFLQRNYATSPIIVFRQKGKQDDVLKNYFTEIENTTASVPLKLKFVTLNSNFTSAQVAASLSSDQVTMCVAGSLSESFAKDLTKTLASLNETHPVHVMGMPTWDVIKDFDGKEYKGLEIFYGTPFYNGRSDKASISIANYFKNNMYSRPSDMVFRGFECLLHFGKLLLEQGANLNSSIGEKKYKVFTDFDIQPVMLSKQSIDYFENKKIYFIKLTDGAVKGIY